MDKPVDIQLLAPKAPGYLLAQTKFVLAGKPEDFAEWGDGTAWDDYFRFDDKVFWTEDPSYWLLIFRVCPEKNEGKCVRLDSEIYVDAEGRHYAVDLAKHGGKDERPTTPKACDTVLHTWGWRFPDSDKRQYEIYTHWILASPFQLAWSRLPPMQAKDRTCEQSKFQQWAYRRGLEHTYSSLEQVSERPVVTEVASAWQEAFALNRALVEALNRAQLGPTERNRRFLYSLVRSLVEENSLLLPRLDQKAFFAYPAEIDKQDREAADRVTKAAFALTHFIESKRFKMFLEDFDTTKDRSAPYKKLVVLDRAYRRATEAPSALPHLKGKAETVTEFLKSHYDTAKAFKDSRKTAKAYWSLVKAFVELADIKSGVPNWLIEPCSNFAEKWFQTKLPVVTFKSARRTFDRNVVHELKGRSTESPVHTRFFAFLEIINVACAVWDCRDAKGDSDALKKKLALAGSVYSLGSVLLDVTKATKKEWVETSKFGKAITSKVVKARIGAASSFIDIAMGGLALVDDVVVDDSKAAAFHGLQAAGGVISLVGYFLIASGGGAPVGAAMVFLGSALGMAGSVGGNLVKTSELENWMKYCQWGELAGKEGVGESPQSWAEGQPKDLHLMVGRQIRILNTMIVGLKIDAALVYDQIQHPSVEVTVHMNILAEEGCIHLEVIIDGVVARKLSPWKHGKDRRDPDGAFREKFSAGDATRVELRVHTDPFGGGHFWHPQNALKKSVALVAPKGTAANPYLERPY